MKNQKTLVSSLFFVLAITLGTAKSANSQTTKYAEFVSGTNFPIGTSLSLHINLLGQISSWDGMWTSSPICSGTGNNLCGIKIQYTTSPSPNSNMTLLQNFYDALKNYYIGYGNNFPSTAFNLSVTFNFTTYYYAITVYRRE